MCLCNFRTVTRLLFPLVYFSQKALEHSPLIEVVNFIEEVSPLNMWVYVIRDVVDVVSLLFSESPRTTRS